MVKIYQNMSTSFSKPCSEVFPEVPTPGFEGMVVMVAMAGDVKQLQSANVNVKSWLHNFHVNFPKILRIIIPCSDGAGTQPREVEFRMS